jgi:hypothetical protein
VDSPVITAVDTNVLIDVVGADPTYGPASRDALDACAREGVLVASPEVVAEFATGCGNASLALTLLDALRVVYVDPGRDVAALAGECRSQASARDRITADYLIAAHAAAHADRLVTRDVRMARMAIEGLVVVSPSEVIKT